MKGINYWRVREQAALERYLAEETDYEARLEEIYKTAADNIEKEIQSLLSKYAATENITMADARKRADRMDVEAFSRKAARYVKEKNFSEKANRELKLYNLKMKISRLELLKKHINLELIAAADEAERELRSDLEKRAMDELKRQAGILGGGAENVAEAAKAIAAGTFYGETFSSRLWTNTEAMNKKLSALLSSGLIRGQNPRVLARSIRDQYIGPERLKNGRRGAVYAAERLMRTELARVQTEAQLRSFEEHGIEEYEFIATTNCCPICDALDGKHFKVRDLVAGENAPPMHPNCRCSAAPWVGEGDGDAEDVSGLNKPVELPDNFTSSRLLPEDIKKMISSTIHELESDYGIRIDRVTFEPNDDKGAVFTFNPYRGDDGEYKTKLKINTAFNWNGSLEEFDERIYNKNYKTGVLAAKNGKDLLFHEAAHFLTFEDCETYDDYIRKESLVRNRYISGVSKYSDLTMDGAETIAEAFVRYKNGEDLPGEVVQLLQDYIGRVL